MEIRKGRCSNYDGCSKADGNEIQEIDALDSFVCKECGHPLDEYVVNKKRGKLPMFWVAAGILVVIVGIVLIIVLSPERQETSIAEQEMNMKGSETLAEDVEAVDAPEVNLESIESEVQTEEPIASSQSIPNITPKNTDPSVTTQNTESQNTKSTTATHKLSYGTWKGALKNGQPDGSGTLTYSTSHLIDSRDSKQRMAEPGEYIIGEWDNGHLVQGRWFKNDGTKEAVIIGKVG